MAAANLAPQQTNRLALVAASEVLAASFADFWVLSGLTDCSFEEGDRNGAFKKPITSFENAGATPEVIRQMRQGVNGLLAELMGRANAAEVVRNKWKGQDLSYRAAGADHPASVEVKLVFDCTKTKFFVDDVMHDWKKLADQRAAGYVGDLFQVVFFLQLPRHDYPRGRWYGGKEYGNRRCYLQHVGIAAQYAQLMKMQQVAPVWPDAPPLVRPLAPVSTENAAAATSRFASAFVPAKPWTFSLNDSACDAAVGVAIWQYP